MLGAGFHLTKLQRAQSDVSHGRSINTSPASSSSNVERFLESVTPSVPAHYLPKVCFNMSQRLKSHYLFILKTITFCLHADDGKGKERQ